MVWMGVGIWNQMDSNSISGMYELSGLGVNYVKPPSHQLFSYSFEN